MKILVVGGGGMIGGDAALRYKAMGHDVTIAGRNAPQAGTPLGNLPFLKGNYIENSFDKADLAKFDAVVFAAGNDVRHIPQDGGDDYWRQANSIAIPRFFESLKVAGVKNAVNIGSFYPQAAPQLVEGNAYIRSRKESDEGVCALADGNFRSMSVNAPFVLGAVDGLIIPMFVAYVQFGQGKLGLPETVPPGGVNFISCRSLSEAVFGAIERGVPGTSYLVGDENLSFQDYFGLFFEAAGRPKPEVKDEEMALLPDVAIFFGRGNTLYYEPDAEENALLGYRRGDIKAAVQGLYDQYKDM
ncbi:NAD-dependent epimerase/dehydratase family protein [Flavisphingomonas formosensis]|uniref:NAD-dependent epimerase/dehydratase family protein n=1 Tax=Flavisphingomonas formosensis TaxID=861534 RepID=UPI0012F9963F|nr:NAD-dependent epimerase/dehydratase family protein [Sphingomonas formosensis]